MRRRSCARGWNILRPTIIFHIGLERTGTTSLQKFCADRWRELRDASILYPKRSLAFGAINHVPLAGCYFSSLAPDFTVVAPPAGKSAVLASLFREIDATRVQAVLLSSEHFSSRLGASQVLDLAADFAGYDCRVAVVVRDHIARFFSSYSTHVVGGGATTLAAYADDILGPENLYCRYADTIELWRKAFGDEKVQVFRYERNRDLLCVMLARLASIKFNAPSLASYNENRLYGPILTEAFRLVNANTLEQRSWSHTAVKWERARIVRLLMRRWISKAAIDPWAGRWSLDDGRLARLKAIAEADHQWLSERCGLRLAPEDPRPSGDVRAAELWARSLIRRADRAWRRMGVLEPLFALALFATRMGRLFRDKIIL
jgi:hypothetical protein